MIFHIHIPKTGGTFLNFLFKSVYGLRYFQVPEPEISQVKDSVPNFKTATTSQFLKSFKGFNNKTKVVSSHYLLPSKELINNYPESCFVFVVRNPKNRLISDYCHKCELIGKIIDFREWADKRRNLQTSMLSKTLSIEEIKKNIISDRFIALRTEFLYEDIAKIFNLDKRNKEKLINISIKNANKGSIYRKKAMELVNNIDITEYIDKDEQLYDLIQKTNQNNISSFELPNALVSSINRYKSRALSYATRNKYYSV
ncbi:sulfotransferase family 2 domain-containing protein [Emcibacteraceae bacterium]|nr:sulfotransferase family 2 domain-containing protein [Emcibacteraceae bacterium]